MNLSCLIEAELQKNKGLADFPQGDALRIVLQRGFQPLDRFPKRFEAEPEGLVVNWNEVAHAGGVTHSDDLLGRGMRSDPRIVGADRHDGDIKGTAVIQLREAVGLRGVAAENNPAAVSFQDVSVVAAVIIAAHSRAPMFHANRADFQRTGGVMNFRFLLPAQLGHLSESCPAKQVACPRRGDQLGAGVETMERPQIEMIEVRVREQDEIDSRQLGDAKRGRGQPFRADAKTGEANSDSRK